MEEPYTNLFDRLGVSPDATDEAVQAIHANWLQRYDHNVDALPADVRQALQFLASAENRAAYSEMLKYCSTGQRFSVAAEKVSDFRIACDYCELKIFEYPNAPNSFVLRRPDQEVPRFAQRQVQPPVHQPSTAELVWADIRRVLLFQVFRGASSGRRLALATAYVSVILGFAIGVHWAVAALQPPRPELVFPRGPTAAELEQARLEALAKSIRTRHAAALDALNQLQAAAERIRVEFQKATGLELDESDIPGAKRSPDLDLALIREESVRDAWTAIMSARVPAAAVEERHRTVAAIEARIAVGTFQERDEQALQDVTAWAQKRTKTINNQHHNIEHIRVMVAAEKFEQSAQTPERSEP